MNSLQGFPDRVLGSEATFRVIFCIITDLNTIKIGLVSEHPALLDLGGIQLSFASMFKYGANRTKSAVIEIWPDYSDLSQGFATLI